MGKLPCHFQAHLENVLWQFLNHWLFHLELSLLKTCATLLCQLWIDSSLSDTTAKTIQGCFHVGRDAHHEELQLLFRGVSGRSLLANPEHPKTGAPPEQSAAILLHQLAVSVTFVFSGWSRRQFQRDSPSLQVIPLYQKGSRFQPTTVEMVDGETSPPLLLTEADLIALMEKHGIGQYWQYGLWLLRELCS